MIQQIISVVIVIAVLCAVVCVTVGMFNRKLFLAVYGTKCTGLSAVEAYIPFYNIVYARKIINGKAPVFLGGFCLCAAGLIFRLGSVVLVAKFPVLIVYSSLAMVVCIALYMLLYIINAVDFCRMLNCGFLTTICCIIVAPVGYYMLSTQVLPYFKQVEDKVSGTFEA